MIYLDFSKKLQVIYIPKNGDYTGKIEDTPTFEEGYDKGYQDGLEDCECGECPECNEGSKYHTVKTDVETLYASVDGLDGYNMVEINASEYGNKKYNEGYSQGYEQGINETDCPECPPCPECKLGELNEELPINRTGIIVHAATRGFDGFDWVTINAEKALQEKYNQGYEQGKSECGDVVCNVGFKYHIVKDENETINASEFGYDGFNEVEIDASEFGNKKYEEGYNQGKSECGEGGSCNIQNGSFEFYDMENGHYWKYAYEYGLDGWDYINIDASEYGRQKYNEGYEQGKSECPECPECPELTELNVTENGTYEGSFNKVNVTVNATDFSSEQVENKYSHLAFITRNFTDLNTIVDKTKLTDRFGNYIPNGSINITQFKNGICLAMDDKYLNPDFNGGCVVRKIEEWAIDWNAVEILRTYTILEFGENMTKDKSSNLLSLYIYASTFRNETVIFNDGCFATSNRLDKIVFEEPFNVTVKGNPFEGISSWGQFIVKGEESNRSKYTDLINLLPNDWEVIFNPDYNE